MNYCIHLLLAFVFRWRGAGCMRWLLPGWAGQNVCPAWQHLVYVISHSGYWGVQVDEGVLSLGKPVKIECIAKVAYCLSKFTSLQCWPTFWILVLRNSFFFSIFFGKCFALIELHKFMDVSFRGQPCWWAGNGGVSTLPWQECFSCCWVFLFSFLMLN